MVTPEEQALIGERMAEAGISNMGAYMRKMALNGYVIHVDLSEIRELVSLQRRCANKQKPGLRKATHSESDEHTLQTVYYIICCFDKHFIE